MNSAHIVIRSARVQDLPRISSLINSHARNGKVLERTKADLRHCLKCFYVALDHGVVVGCCALEAYSKKLAEIRSLVVDRAHQKKGVASALIAACIREAKRKKIYEVLVITDRVSIFHRVGFSQQLHGQSALFLRP